MKCKIKIISLVRWITGEGEQLPFPVNHTHYNYSPKLAWGFKPLVFKKKYVNSGMQISLITLASYRFLHNQCALYLPDEVKTRIFILRQGFLSVRMI